MRRGQLRQGTSPIPQSLGTEELESSRRSIQVTCPSLAANDPAPCSNTTINKPNEFFDYAGFELGAGDWVQVHTPGGGGYGDPGERPRELVQRDLRCGYFSEATAESDYGYVP